MFEVLGDYLYKLDETSLMIGALFGLVLGQALKTVMVIFFPRSMRFFSFIDRAQDRLIKALEIVTREENKDKNANQLLEETKDELIKSILDQIKKEKPKKEKKKNAQKKPKKA